MRAKLSLALASVLVSVLAATAPADAACKKFGFTVNDYGKEGPTNDAKNLLDKHIAEWAAQNGVTAYQTGKKTRQLRALPRRHPVRRAYLHRLRQRLLGRRRQAEQQDRRASRGDRRRCRRQRRCTAAPGPQSRRAGHCPLRRSRAPLPRPAAAHGCRRRADDAGRADRRSGRDAGRNARRSHAGRR